MPELPEVETVKETLKRKILNKQIKNVEILYKNIIEYPTTDEFKKEIINQKINDIKRRGKWLIFELDKYYLLSHLRMEGKYNLKVKNDKIDKHDHILFNFKDNTSLRYNDTRKFGKMYLILKHDLENTKPIKELGLEPWDKNLTVDYLKEKYKNKTIPIKTSLLDQSIIVGIGNIYVDEILFLSKINPLIKCKDLKDKDLKNIIIYTRQILNEAIKKGGTTIKSYTSSEGVHGKFQQELLVHTKKICPTCNSDIIKIRVNGRGTYYCPICQKER